MNNTVEKQSDIISNVGQGITTWILTVWYK